jgi:hypothetical protein
VLVPDLAARAPRLVLVAEHGHARSLRALPLTVLWLSTISTWPSLSTSATTGYSRRRAAVVRLVLELDGAVVAGEHVEVDLVGVDDVGDAVALEVVDRRSR